MSLKSNFDGGWLRFTLIRRRSFHDLDTFRGIEVLTPERMKIDVEICGQMLIIYRRAEHLQNVITTIRVSFFSL